MPPYNNKFTFTDLNNEQKKQSAVHAVLKDAHINCIPIQEEDLAQIKNSLKQMTFSKVNIDLPSLLYGASISCFFSVLLAYDGSNATPTIWGIGLAFSTWVVAGFLSKSKKYKNNNEKNETHRDHALGTIDRVFRSSKKSR